MVSSFKEFRPFRFFPVILVVFIFISTPLLADETSPELLDPGTQTISESAPGQTIETNPSEPSAAPSQEDTSKTKDLKTKGKKIEEPALPEMIAMTTSVSGSGAGESTGSNVSIEELMVSNGPSSGAAITRIPILVPPGRNGVSPKLFLEYNSNRKNGWIGVGWDLDMGSIQRSTKFGVDYNADDYVAIKNDAVSELVPRTYWGQNYYGAKIEESFSKYYKNSATGGWEVLAKDGTIYFYGTTAASRQDDPTNPNRIFKWCLDRVEDANGNYMTVSYTKNQGQIYLDRIDYTGNTTGLSPANYVKFYLETRTDVPPMYTTNYKVITANRIKNIEVYGNDQLVRKYEFDYGYGNSTGRSLIHSINQYGSDGLTQLPALTFEWSDPYYAWLFTGAE